MSPMATEMKWSNTIHPTEIAMANSSKTSHEDIVEEESKEVDPYEEAKEHYEEAKEAYEIALEDLSNLHSETEKARQAMIEAREAFLNALQNDKIEEEPCQSPNDT